jgi:hypothetical protein
MQEEEIGAARTGYHKLAISVATKSIQQGNYTPNTTISKKMKIEPNVTTVKKSNIYPVKQADFELNIPPVMIHLILK